MTQGDDRMKDALIDLSHEIIRAIAERDDQALNRILDDDFVHFASGSEPSSPQTKQEFVSAITRADYQIVDISLESLRVKFDGDLAVVAGIQKAEVRLADEQTLASCGSFTDVFRRVDARWRLWLAHSTELPAC